ncbi:helix-turn-helix domain-containing protein [Bacillus pseudomycoides]|uniref:helix-turn-helix domain-containing protein n=1 Tax=Bacillus pseudomycoides TaxID=64104 RepID=UPI00211D1D0A|nr:helix-turn-helix domain-containing protein [Bacillus pseudomycoides]
MKELRKYETFKSIAEMDNSIDLYLKKYTLKDSERVILLALSRYSCKFVGVSYLKNATLSEVTGLSVRTVQRAYKRLSLLGIVVRHEQFKPVKGGHSAFITTIIPYESHTVLSSSEEDDKPTRGNDEESPHENETITHKANPNNKYILLSWILLILKALISLLSLSMQLNPLLTLLKRFILYGVKCC